MASPTPISHIDAMKKLFAILVALACLWVIITPFDFQPLPDFFIDEAIALIILTKTMSYLGIDISRFLPFINMRKNRNAVPPVPEKKAPSAKDAVIDV